MHPLLLGELARDRQRDLLRQARMDHLAALARAARQPPEADRPPLDALPGMPRVPIAGACIRTAAGRLASSLTHKWPTGPGSRR